MGEFVDVFPKEIPGLPPQWAIDFTIDLVPGTGPISYFGQGLEDFGQGLYTPKCFTIGRSGAILKEEGWQF